MMGIEIYYRNTILMLEEKARKLDEIFFDINFQLKDEGLNSYDDQVWRNKARFKLRKVNAEISLINEAIKRQKRKLNIATHFKPLIESRVSMTKDYCIAQVENEVLCQVLRAKLKSVMGVDGYINYMESDVSKIQEEIRESAINHFSKSNRMPVAIEIYNWK